MQQKLFLTVAMLLGCGQLMAAKSAADFFIEFNTMEEGHKKDWIDYCSNRHKQEADLMKSQVHDWVSLKNKHLKNATGMKDCSAEAINKKISNHLDSAIALHKKHNMKWKDWCEKSYNDAKNIAKRHDTQLEKFEVKYHGTNEEMPMKEMKDMKGMEA